MATIRDVAERAGVSVATVSHVLNGTRKVADQTACRVRTAMDELDYHPDASAQSLRRRTTKVVGVLVSDIANPFFAAVVRGAEAKAREEGYSLLIGNTGESPEDEEIYLQLLRRKRVDGVLVAPTGNCEPIERMVRRGTRVVLIDRKLPGIEAPAVLSENRAGGHHATDYLLAQGHRRIGIILGLPEASTTTERLSGYKDALASYGVSFCSGLVACGYSQVREGMEACRALLNQPRPPTAIFATNNLMTLGALQAIHSLGLRCPDDVSLVGFDDFEWVEAFDPPLTTVAQDPFQIGQTAASTLLASLRGEDIPNAELRINTELRIRGSVSPCDAGSDPSPKGVVDGSSSSQEHNAPQD